MESSSSDFSEGSGPWVEQAIHRVWDWNVLQVYWCFSKCHRKIQEVVLTTGTNYKDCGFEEMDNDNCFVGRWTRCPGIIWTICLSLINTFYEDFSIQTSCPWRLWSLYCPFHGHFRGILYHVRSEVFENMRLRLICAQGSGNPEFELCPRRGEVA